MKKILNSILLIISLALILAACGEMELPEGTDSDPSSSQSDDDSSDSDDDSSDSDDDDHGKNETKISQFNDLESHNMGQNCVSCHVSGGRGEGWFNVSGTVYRSDNVTAYPNGQVKLYTEANQGGTLVKTIAVDGRGNFYTTESINFGSGLYAVVVYNNQVTAMNSKTISGNCNSCHVNGGSAGNVIYAP